MQRLNVAFTRKEERERPKRLRHGVSHDWSGDRRPVARSKLLEPAPTGGLMTLVLLTPAHAMLPIGVVQKSKTLLGGQAT